MKYEEFKSELDNLLKGTEIEDVMSDVFYYMDESDFYSMRIVDEKVRSWISEQEIIYYSRAINYLQENDPSLRYAFAAAEEYGFTLDSLDAKSWPQFYCKVLCKKVGARFTAMLKTSFPN